MYEILIGAFAISFCNILFLFITDKELKYLNELGVKKTKLVTVTKFSFLLIYQKRKEKIITKLVLVNAIIFYLVNLLALTFLVLHFALKADWFFIISCILLFSNVIGIVEMGLRTSLNNEQKKIKLQDQKRRKNK